MLTSMKDHFRDLLQRVTGKKPSSPRLSIEEARKRYRVHHHDSLIAAPIKVGKDFSEQHARTEMNGLLEELVEVGNDFPVIIAERATVSRIEKLGQKLWEIEDVSSFWMDTLQQAHESGGVEAQSLVIAHGWNVGASLLAVESIEQREAIISRITSEDEFSVYQRYFQLRKFIWKVGSVKVGDVALRDFLGFRPGKQSPAPLYRFLIDGTTIAENGRHREVYAENMEPPNNEFPHATMQTIDVLGNSVLSVEHIASMGLGLVYGSSLKGAGAPEIMSEIGSKSKQISDRVSDVQKASLRAILNPKSKDFPEMAQTVSSFLEKEDPLIDSRILGALGLVYTSKILDFYRQTGRLASTIPEAGFYNSVHNTVDQIVEGLGSFVGVVTHEEVLDLLGEEEQTSKETTQADMKKTVSGVFNKTRNPDLEINPSDINWSGLPTPTEAVIDFDKAGPMKFRLQLKFSNELKEDILIRARFDLSKGIFDWNLKYDPSGSEEVPEDIRTFRSLLMVATGNILDSILTKTIISKATEKETGKPAQSAPKTPRERYQDPVYALRKEARAGVLEPEQEAVNLNQTVIESNYRNFVDLPKDNELVQNLARLSTVDAAIIKAAIEEYNEKGTGGKFTRKRGKGKDGEARFTLSIGCTTPKGVRVLLKESDSEAGIRIFEIEDIRYRKDIYRANNL